MGGAAFFGWLFPHEGYNQYLGWSHSNNSPDIADVYAEVFDDTGKPLLTATVTATASRRSGRKRIKVKTASGLAGRKFILRKTHHGPIVAIRDGRPLAVRLAKLEEGGILDQLYGMGKARSFAEFKKALSRLALPFMNTIYADREGNIAKIWQVRTAIVGGVKVSRRGGSPCLSDVPRSGRLLTYGNSFQSIEGVRIFAN